MKDRSKFIGGSDIPNILGHGYLTPYETYLLKKGQIEIPNSFEAEMGKKLEPVIADQFINHNTIESTLRDNWLFNNQSDYGIEVFHPTIPYLQGHLDGHNAKEAEILECKATQIPINKDEIPTHWLLQVAFYCELANAKRAYIAVLYKPTKIHVYIYERNEKLQKYIIDKCVDFWENHILTNIPPLAITNKDIQLMNKKLFHLDRYATPLEANSEQMKLINEYKELKAQRMEISKKEEELRIKLFNEIKNYDSIKDEYGNELLTYRFNKKEKETINKDLLKSKYPKIYAEVVRRENPSRVLRLK